MCVMTYDNISPSMFIYRYSIYKPNSGLLQILPFDWLSYSLSIGDRPLVAKGMDFQIQGLSWILNILSDL